MKNFLILCMLAFSNLIIGQAEEIKMTQLLDLTINKTREISLYSETVDWDKLSAYMHSNARDAQKIEDLKPALEIMLNSLRDHHGNIKKLSDYSSLAHFTDHSNSRNPDDREFDSEIWSIVNDINSKFEYKILPHNIAYLKVVGVGPNLDGQLEAERIRNAIAALNEDKVRKWIIDLRYNGGGNINVMLSGLAPLLDTKTVASIRDQNKEILFDAEIIDHDFWYAGVNAFPIQNKFSVSNPKIAILLSRWTVSSGELVAVAFKGQKNTKFFGEKTGGYTTNNCWEIIEDEFALVISTGVYCDRNGQEYERFVLPDENVDFEVVDEIKKDTGIIHATNWLKLK